MIYENLGLNMYMQPVTSPTFENMGVSAYDFVSNNERNIISTSFVQEINANKINAGTVTVAINLGTTGTTAFLKLDGENNRIVVNDGTVDRIWIGNLTP